MTYNILKGIITKLLENRGAAAYGEQTLKKLNIQGKQLENVNIAGEDIKNFRKCLNRYSVDFAVMRDKNAGVYSVFFVDRVYKALENCVKDISIDRSSKRPASEVIAEAVRKAGEQARDMKDPPEIKGKGMERE